MSNDALFAVVVMLYGMGILAVTCIVMGIIEWIAERAERRRRKKYRNNYVRFK